jgi:transcriptional regulator with GAF, ATPase, and Fis domain
MGVVSLAGYWAAAFLAFMASNLILPLFYPTVIGLAILGGLELLGTRQRRTQDDALKTMLEDQITQKQAELERAKLQLDEIGDQLTNESSASQEIHQVAEERKQTILELEKQLADLKTYSLPKREALGPIFSEIVHAHDSRMTDILELIPKIASDDIPVLILGETGTGKEMVARAIHVSSGRKEAPFVAVNCGALPETLLDSELFGHEKGSFTGAQAQRRGRFELAHGGTIFLDEITETSLAFQARMLRVLQECTFERLGGEKSVTVDVRVIAATNRDIQALIDESEFRADLYYRLNGFTMELPRLRDRPTDVPILVIHFLKKHGYGPAIGISNGAVQALQKYPWPGNVRELENVTRRAALLAKSERRTLLQLEDLSAEVRSCASTSQPKVDFVSLEDQILASLRDLQFSRAAISKTAQVLGNRDRGTVTEYFRGICFRELVQADFDMEVAIRAVASTAEESILANVRGKFSEYLQNLHPLPADLDIDMSSALPSQFKGLPKKFHPFLAQVIEHLRKYPSEV